MPKYNQERCIYCGACVSVCPVACLTLKETYIEIDQAKCINCGACVKVCPMGAMSIPGKIEKKK